MCVQSRMHFCVMNVILLNVFNFFINFFIIFFGGGDLVKAKPIRY